MFFSGNVGAILKLLVVVILIWLSNPVASHLVCKIEVETNENITDECEVEEIV